MSSNFQKFRSIIIHPLKYRLFLLSKLPMGFLAGLKVKELSQEKSAVIVRFKWLNQNPFKSIYFAVLSMAAELSTGVLAFANVYKSNPVVSMLIVKVNGEFYKKAVGKIIFTCNKGSEISNAIQQTIAIGESVFIECESIGKNEKGETVAKFIFTWSFKVKS